MFTIGLTGGIASGKTAATNLFTELNIAVIDTDIIAREIVMPELPAWQAILDHFGSEILNKDNHINRALLREIIFADTDEKEWLEHLLHPLIRRETAQQLSKADSAYAVVAIPLLVESEPNPLLDRVLLIDAPADLQLERLIQRDQCTVAQGLSMIAAQATQAQRQQAADDIIENTGTKTDLKRAIATIHQTYLNTRTKRVR